MTTESIIIAKLHLIAAETHGSVRLRYSGRNMFGATCVGIVGDDLSLIAAVGRKYGFTNPRSDELGLHFIVYWPDISLGDEPKFTCLPTG